MRVHFIAIGGSAMHNLAIALQRKGVQVTGSDDEIFEPSKGRLDKEGILPNKIGWNENNIHDQLDAIILGMHAREDNKELLKAKKLGLKIYSYPEYIFEQTKDKKRIVIGGSHGKTSVTSMILHVLNTLNVEHDYMVGAQLEGYDCMVSLTDSAPIVILEGDEYLSSPIDRRPKFHLYNPNIAVITGIAWDHINVFPTWENYVEQFQEFVKLIEPEGELIYYQNDDALSKMSTLNKDISITPYQAPAYEIKNNKIQLNDDGIYTLQIIGKHNVENLKAAQLVCQKLGISKREFYTAASSFKGASKRLEKIAESETSIVYKDFAHSPSKLKATTSAVKEQFPDRRLIAVMELHTFSSLNKKFIDQYHGAMEKADEAIVYFSPEVLKHKKLPNLSIDEVMEAFGGENISVYTSSEELVSFITSKAPLDCTNLLIMTSGNLSGNNLDELGQKLV
ncbi:MAG TPA: peptidoglycan synthetase [Flavobacteriales bacterium]|nr:peptidoglycan synthetase [Flavobacteriales bacterium]|tara:strand:- start:8466 stop:9818 length:1353 start_codon:yes stop_codon:yes gene_type:complete